MIYCGRDGLKTYELGKRLGRGAEGVVYEVMNKPQLVAKIYQSSRFSNIYGVEDGRDYLYSKISCMLDYGLDPYLADARLGKSWRILTVAWPVDLLANDEGAFVGFVMPNARMRENLLVAEAEDDRKNLFGRYTWRHSLTIARNLAMAVSYLHAHDVVVGDFNSNNAMVAPDCSVTLVDVDSFTVSDVASGVVYKSMGGVGEVLAPELQGKNLQKQSSVFTKESDCFSLAIHVFYLLMSYHPFGVAGMDEAHDSVADPLVTAIARGNCPYVTGSSRPGAPTAPDMRTLPDYLRDLFDRTFNYTAQNAVRPEIIAARPTAEEWLHALDRALSGPFITCATDSHHVFLDTHWLGSLYGGCPWCEREARKRQLDAGDSRENVVSYNDLDEPNPTPPHKPAQESQPSIIPIQSPIPQGVTPSHDLDVRAFLQGIWDAVGVPLLVMIVIGLLVWGIVLGAEAFGSESDQENSDAQTSLSSVSDESSSDTGHSVSTSTYLSDLGIPGFRAFTELSGANLVEVLEGEGWSNNTERTCWYLNDGGPLASVWVEEYRPASGFVDCTRETIEQLGAGAEGSAIFFQLDISDACYPTLDEAIAEFSLGYDCTAGWHSYGEYAWLLITDAAGTEWLAVAHSYPENEDFFISQGYSFVLFNSTALAAGAATTFFGTDYGRSADEIYYTYFG